jgi:SAM-dependent methyltransferase
MRVSDSRFLNILKQPPLRQTENQYFFIESADREDYDKKMKADVNQLKSFLKKWPGFYYFLLYGVSEIFFGGLSAKKAVLKAFPKSEWPEKVILNLGSGPRKYHEEIINVDIYPFKNVDLVADLHCLPLKDQSADMVIVESVMEHLPKINPAVKEISRIVKKGGYLYGLVPFLYPFHASPNDYYRWTAAGLKEQFADFDLVVGMRSGPVTALLSVARYALASLLSFGVGKLYLFWSNLLMVALSPLKFLDLIFFLFPQSVEAASFLYFFGRKR